MAEYPVSIRGGAHRASSPGVVAYAEVFAKPNILKGGNHERDRQRRVVG